MDQLTSKSSAHPKQTDGMDPPGKSSDNPGKEQGTGPGGKEMGNWQTDHFCGAGTPLFLGCPVTEQLLKLLEKMAPSLEFPK